MFGFGKRSLASVPSVAQPSGTTSAGILDAYCMERPSQQTALDIFRGEWSSAMPSGSGLVTAPGSAALFQDSRVSWAIEQAGGGGRGVAHPRNRPA